MEALLKEINRRSILLLATMLLFLTACSSDETMETNDDSQAIRFEVAADNMTRAAHIYGSNSKPEKFKVWAKYRESPTAPFQLYIGGDEYETNDGGQTYVGHWTRYWPKTSNGNMYFCACANTGEAIFQWDDYNKDNDGAYNKWPKLASFTVADKPSEQKDFIYASTSVSGRIPADGSNTVGLHFHHALSQIVFRAKCTNPTLKVEIESVSVTNLHETADYIFPSNGGGHGRWRIDGSVYDYDGKGTRSYTITCNPLLALTGKADDGPYPFPSDDEAKQLENAMLLLPHKTRQWDLTAANKSKQTYFLVKCRICNVAEDGTEKQIWGTDDEKPKDVIVPASFAWEEGKKYIYTFCFGKGNGGVDPDNPDKPVLFPISFTCNVDDFIGDGETDVKTEE